MNFTDCGTNEMEFQICTHCKKIRYKVHKMFGKIVNVYYQHLLTFVIFHNKRVY